MRKTGNIIQGKAEHPCGVLFDVTHILEGGRLEYYVTTFP
jgi:hypothetical protein